MRSLKKHLIITVIAIILTGCSGNAVTNKSTGQNTGEQVKVDTSKEINKEDNSSTNNIVPASSDSVIVSANSQKVQSDSQETVLSNIMKLAKEGKTINCQFPVESTTIDKVIEKWGEPDKSDWVPSASGTYATFTKHNAVFGFNKGEQIYEVRSFDSQLCKISISDVKKCFGKPAYDVKTNNEQIIGYTAGEKYKILIVFPQKKNNNSEQFIDHYSVFYPAGTVNYMADYPGRKW